MGIAAIVCNVAGFAITGVIVVTEGVPRDPRDLGLTLLMLLIPLLTTVILVRRRAALQRPSSGDEDSSTITPAGRAAVLCNLVLFGASCWAAVAQYPYPEGNSVIPFAVLAVGTPLLSVVVLLGGGRKAMRAPRPSTGDGESGRAARDAVRS